MILQIFTLILNVILVIETWKVKKNLKCFFFLLLALIIFCRLLRPK